MSYVEIIVLKLASVLQMPYKPQSFIILRLQIQKLT